MLVYLSGPMSGIEEYNYPVFTEACAFLRSVPGMFVISPHELDTEEDVQHGEPWGWVGPDEEYERLLKRDFEVIPTCDAIVFLPGWENSGGAGREGRVALEAGLKMYTYKPKRSIRVLPLSHRKFKHSHVTKRRERIGA